MGGTAGPAGVPIAVVGVSCRLPQAGDPAAFWRLLVEGTDAITDPPAGRWVGAAGGHRGGFLDDVEGFDAAFFGISPHEAAAMDPQQRLALELAWEALEEARIVPADLNGTVTGVFLAAISQEYAALTDRLGPDASGRHTYTGTHRSLIANRVSYTLGLRGPSLTVDCGQSSSLVAVHLACQSLRRGESAVALAGGVDLNLLTDTTKMIDRFGALSPDGRCHVFDERANGYVRGEGGALVVLKPLPAALRDGERIHAVIHGSAVNNDGGGTDLTAPTARGQQAVITQACADAGLATEAIQYVELHGTGTPVGDPVEAAGLGAALGPGRPVEAPLLVGSVKTNVGHLEGAAGITGLLKVVLALAHEQLPASLHFQRVNPAIDLAGLGLRMVDTPRPWSGPALAGVSSFGMGGTNCHVVLGSAPAREPAQPATLAAGLPWLISARHPDALRAQAQRLAPVAAGADADDVARALLYARSAHTEQRAVILADPGAAVAALAAGRPHPAVVTGAARRGPVVLTFPGQGSQWPEMARQLRAESPVFAARLAECAEALEAFVDYPLLEVLDGAPGGPDFERVDVVQPALWAVMVSLAELWRAHGVTPDVLIGHSQGEIAAATVGGALSLADGARVVALRSRALRAIAGSGGMLSLGAPLPVVEAAVAALAARYPQVTLAAVNGPYAAVVSGPIAALTALERDFEQAGHRARMVPVDYASHSVAVEPIREELLARLGPLRPRSCDPLFVSTLTGAPMDTAGLDAGYWYRSLRHPVQFATAVRHALDLGAAVAIECSAHPVAVTAVEQAAEQAEVPLSVIGTLRRGDGGLDRFRFALAQAHVAGAPVQWAAGPSPERRELVELPTYAFQRRRHWLAGTPSAATGTPSAAPGTPSPAAAVEPAPEVARPTASRRELRELVRSMTAQVLGYAAALDVDPARTFKDLGVDSTTAVDLRNRLRSATGLTLPTGLLFDHPTVDRVAAQLHGLLGGAGAPASPAAPAPGSSGEPIAIVAMGCRLPGGVSSPEDLWRLVCDGQDAITAFPTDRGWDLPRLAADGPERSGTSDTRYGGFLHDADQFDAGFFGISPREALAMDPQQRLLLEVCWETFERAGIDPATVSGTDTGVFVGAMATDYGPRLHQPTGAVDGHLLTGTALSVTSGRIAYQLGLLGPALTVDTACSSSLVALQLAVRALRSGDCMMALAGGASVMATPGMFVEFSRQGGLAVDGRCKAFAAGADGTAWAEGVGVLLLMRSSQARRLGHPVLAEVRGVAVNQDGRSNGLTAPNGPAQERVIRQALTDAGLRPADVDVVEAHGTGTRLGDPLEATALQATYGREHSAQQPLWLGSLKSNVGHTQAAAGVAGVIKMVLALQHRLLPRTLHAAEPTTHVDWSDGALRLLQEPVPLAADRPVRAAVSSFGISGTNAHVVLESPPVGAAEAGEAAAGPLVWVFSARTETALRALAVALCDYATTAPAGHLAAAGRTLAGRSAFAHRAAVVAGDRAQLQAGLAALAQGAPHAAVVTGIAAPDVHPVFVFPGQGTQWAGMAVDLLAGFPVFAEHLRRCDGALAPLTGWSVLDVLHGADGAPPLAGSDVIQPVLFAVMVSLSALWRSVGVEPAAVLGHSQGEIAAACAAGALPIEDAARIVLLRSRALMKLTGTGGMLALAVPAERAGELVAPYADRLWVAILNGPQNTVLAGDVDALAAVEAACAEQGVRARRVAIDYAAHTPHVQAVQADLLAELAGTTPQSTDIAICSSATGGLVAPAELTAEFWYAGLRNTVRFDEAVRSCAGEGSPLYVEVSPHPALIGHVQDTLRAAGLPGQALGSLRRGEDGPQRFRAALGQAFVAGADVDWAAVLGPAGHPPPGLPTYPFDHRRYWIDPPTPTADPALTGIAARHPAITAVVPMAGDDGLLVNATVSATTLPWLADHAVGGTVLLPGTAFVELALAAGEAAGCDLLADLTLELPLVVPDGGRSGVAVQLVVGGPREDGRRALSVHSRRPDEPGWVRHATGTLDSAPPGPSAPAPWPPAGASQIDVSGLYGELLDRGYDYGPAFQGVTAAWREESATWVEVALPEPAATDAGRYLVHPALLDAALHLLVIDSPSTAPGGDSGLVLPFSWRGVRVGAAGPGSLRVRLVGTGEDRAALTAYDGAGQLVAQIDELVLRRVPRPADQPPQGDGLQRVGWVDLTPAEAAAEPLRWTVVDPDASGAEIFAALHRTGADVGVCYDLPSVADLTTGDVADVVLVPVRPDVDLGDPAYDVRECLYSALDLVQGWLGDPRFAASRLVFVTAGALSAAGPGGLVASAVWGLVRSAQAEHPDRFGLVDLDSPDAPWAGIAAALGEGEWELRVRDGTVRVPRLRPARATVDAPDLAGRTVLVTGGTSGLGALVARRLVEEHGARHLLLVSRRGSAAPGAEEVVAALGDLGAEVTATACDVTDRAAVRALLTGIPAERPLAAVIHAAGVVDDGTVEGLSTPRLDAVLAPKLDAGWVLHEATRDLALSRFVTFSSVAGVLGNAGQANYAAANAFLDGLAAHRQATGLPATSIAWGLWDLPTTVSGGLDAAGVARLGRAGIAPMATADGLRRFDAAWRSAEPLVVAARWDGAGLRTRGVEGALAPALRELAPAPRRTPVRSSAPPVPTTAASAAPGAAPAAGLTDRLAQLADADGRRLLTDLIRSHVAAVLAQPGPEAVEVHRAFQEMGFDSLTAVELRNRLDQETGLVLSATVAFDHPNVAALAEHLHTALAPAAAPSPEEALRACLADLRQAVGPEDDTTRRTVTALLRRALAGFENSSRGPEDQTGGPVDLDALASDEQLFAYIDGQT